MGKLKESLELILQKATDLVDRASTVENFVSGLVGKKLKDLLNAASFARLYVLNKYGVGGFPDEDDAQAQISELMDNLTAFINFRKLDSLAQQRKSWEDEKYSTPEYNNWLKQRSLAFKAYVAARNSGSKDTDELRKQYQSVASSDPTLGDYRSMMKDREELVTKFHETPLKLADVLPSLDDTEEDKKRWRAVEKSFDKLKKHTMNESKFKKLIKSVIKEMYSDESNYPTATVQISTLGGTNVLLYKGNAKERDEAVSDLNYKTPTKFNTILRYVRDIKSKEAVGEPVSLKNFMSTDRDVISTLLNLDDSELNELETEKIVVTNNLPNEFVELTGKNIPTDEPVDENKRKVKKESGDPFRDIVKKNAAIYRDHELDRREKEDYARWLAVHKPDELNKKLKALKKK